MPERDRAHEDGDEAVALRRQADRDAVDRERDAERVQRLRVRRDRVGQLAPARHQLEAIHAARRRTRTRASRPGARTATRRSRRRAPSAAVKASTAGSASPSLSPDSRLSEWRTSRGTRGLVTTEEESTGSVGDSSAPSRNDSSQPRPTTQCVADERDQHAGDRHRRARACGAAGATPSGASPPRPRARRGTGSRSARRPRGRARSPSARRSRAPPGRRRRARSRPARTAPSATGTSAARARRRARPTISRPPRTSSTVSRLTGIESASEFTRGRASPRCESPCSASRRPGRTRTGPAAAT